MPIRVHAIILALNEESFIEETIRPIYDHLSGISVITQYDRDYYGNKLKPDSTALKVLNYPDPEGKIHFVCRRFVDETAARNMEMLSVLSNPIKGKQGHGVEMETIQKFHAKPDYFLIVDADEIYDINTFGNIIKYLAECKPNGLRVSGYNYVRSWNERIPLNIMDHKNFGFVKAGILFEMRRQVTWNESRIAKLLSLLKLPNFSAKIFGFKDCPREIGLFHHGAYIGGDGRLAAKKKKHSHPEVVNSDLQEERKKLFTEKIKTLSLPENIRNGIWPIGFLENKIE